MDETSLSPNRWVVTPAPLVDTFPRLFFGGGGYQQVGRDPTPIQEIRSFLGSIFVVFLMIFFCFFFGFVSAGVQPCSATQCADDEQCQVDETGRAQCLCPGPCPPVHRPVCGSDRRTYSSACQLQRESCLQKRNLSLHYEGVCGNKTNKTNKQDPSPFFNRSSRTLKGL